jgi:hypothetical protein
MSKLSDRVRPDVEVAPWVRDEILQLEARLAAAEAHANELGDYLLAVTEELDMMGHCFSELPAAVAKLVEDSDQIDRLAKYIMAEVPGEPSQSEGAVDTAIRVMRDMQARLAAAEEKARGCDDCPELIVRDNARAMVCALKGELKTANAALAEEQRKVDRAEAAGHDFALKETLPLLHRMYHAMEKERDTALVKLAEARAEVERLRGACEQVAGNLVNRHGDAAFGYSGPRQAELLAADYATLIAALAPTPPQPADEAGKEREDG